MGSDREGRGSEAVAASKPRKRQLVMESSDSEADEFCISTRQNASGAASLGNAGVSSQGSGDRSEEKPVTSSPEKLPGVKSSDVDGSDKKTGVQLESSSSQPAVKRIRVETVHGDGNGCSGGASKCGTGGKMLPRGLPAWRFERPEVRGGRVLDDKGGVSMKASSASKMKEQVSSLGDKRQAELQKHERRTPLKTDQGKAIDSGQQEVLRLQGKRGVLRILPKNDKVTRDTGDGKILSRQTEVDEETGNGRIPTKRGVLKLLPKNNGAVMESNECKLLSKKVKVDEETGDDKMPMKKTKVVDKETSDGKILAITTNLDAEFGGHKLPMKNCTVDMETVAGKFQQKNSKADGETKGRYKGYEEKSGAPAEFQKHDANGEKRVLGKLLSPVALRKSDPSVVGVSLGQRMKQQNSKQQLKNYSLSLKDDSTKSSEQKNLKKRLLEHKGSSESLSKKAQLKAVDQQATSGPVLNKLEKKPRGGPLNKHKQDLRNKIKHVLLDNGWKIDLRQRKNKDYEDSVYVSPTGTGYWSITKAYAVFQEQFQNMGRSSKLNNTKPGASDAISKDDLALLKKNIVKRRTNKEICGAEKKPGVSRNRSSKDILANRDFRNKHQNKEDRVKIKDRRCGLLVRGSTHDTEDNMDGYIPYEWKRTLCSWMIDLGVISEDMHVKYMNSNRTREMLAGKITREGIFCGCCSKILTIAKFELHAGSKEKKPYANIFLEGGKVSLLQCLLDAWEKHTQSENKGFYKIDKGDDEHDDTCAICGDGGDLVCCDHCASTFHLDCLGIKLPSGDWYCRSCLCRFCGFPQEKPSSSPELLLSCLQCSRKYHQTCSSGTGTDSGCTMPGTSIDCFCSPGCRKIYKRLNKLLGIKNHMEAGFSWSLVHCFANDQAMPNKNKEKLAQCNSKTALAFTVLDECFQPHIDDRSGINMIHNVAYNCGSDFSRLDFSGFYAFILERGDEVIAAASVRIHGTDLAEMPFIGTRGMYRHQGMCRRLLNGIESALGSLSVQKLVVSAVTEMENTWTTGFGFKPVAPSKKQRMKSLNLLIMNGTGLLEKRLLPTQTVDGQITTKTGLNTKLFQQKFSLFRYCDALMLLDLIRWMLKCLVKQVDL
uniref:Acyl-CoA N-acyltransferase with RING/FYVE/PHD-type zinc finger protein n=1 Tax=Zea mays TaxID=4577 RepID=A0A804UCS4_MAIZE|eukprot:XP_020396932.1 increased DNA methylation 1 isoform X2 [Zea mays]